MRNPFKSEADAFRLVILALGYFALIVVAAAINRWLGLAVFVLLTLGAIAWIVRARREPPERTSPIRRSAPGERRILVIANETVGGEKLREEIRRRAEDYEERVRVICPRSSRGCGSSLPTRTAPAPRRRSASSTASRGSARSASIARARSARRTRYRRLLTPSEPSARTRSSSRPTQKGDHCGSSAASYAAHVSASTCRSPTSSSTSKPKIGRAHV